MKRQILSIALILCMLLSIVPLTPVVATAETVTPNTVVASGTCGEAESDSITWELSSDGTMTIDGSGDMMNFSINPAIGTNDASVIENCPWKDYVYSITSVVIGDEVASIGENAFIYHSNLATVSGGKNLTGIGQNAFAETKLANYDIPSGVTKISDGTFSGCNNLLNCTIPYGITTIGNFAFQGCLNLKQIVIPNSVTSIGNTAFHGCKALEKIVIPSSVKTVGVSAFEECSSLVSVTFEGDVTEIEKDAFLNCTALKTLIFEGNVAKIKSDAFRSCTGLTDIYLFGDVTEIGRAFRACTSVSKVYCYDDNTTVGNLTGNISSSYKIVYLNGTCGATESDSVTWKLKPDGTLSLSGAGTVADYSSTDAPWKEFVDKGMIKNVTIGKNVTFSSLGVSECSYTVSSETALKAAVGNDGTVILGDSITIGSTLIIKKEITLDLNGHELKYSSTGYGSVIHVNSGVTFTLNDSSPAGTGTVTGGTGFEVVVDYGEGMVLKNYYGGGVFNYGDFIMNGGTIKDCLLTTSFEDGTCSFGGGVCTVDDGTFTMNGGSIENCSAVLGAGVYISK